MRGENRIECRIKDGGHGPSPHAWGKRHAQTDDGHLVRTIPTCVGKTAGARKYEVHRTDHPHMRGENQLRAETLEHKCGPSPHAWGKPRTSPPGSLVARTIPTCVGKTPLAYSMYTVITDHPHMRGENWLMCRAGKPLFGPSPHAWGKHLRKTKTGGWKRTIPTCVGKTFRRRSGAFRCPDHPHMRGENSLASGLSARSCGPSPHAWGKQRWGWCWRGSGRTIPTCVGKTRKFCAMPAPSADHPHMRGENTGDVDNVFAIHGPSPHAWGKLNLASRTLHVFRTIPTCVGKTT